LYTNALKPFNPVLYLAPSLSCAPLPSYLPCAQPRHRFVQQRDAYIAEHIASHDFPPRQFFYEWQGRGDVLDDPTFALLRAMPKGANLHLHSGSSGSVDWLVDEGLSLDGAYVFWGDDAPDGTCISSLGGQVFPCDDANSTLFPLLHGTVAFYDAAAPAGGPNAVPAGLAFQSVAALRAADPDFNAKMR